MRGDVFGQTKVIASGPQSESVEQVVIEQVNRLGLDTQTTESSVEDLRVNDPLTYQQLKSDLKIVDHILDLADEIKADEQTVAQISNQAVETAVKRSGLIQETTQTANYSTEDVETEPELETQTENEQTETVRVKVQEVDDQIPLTPPVKDEKSVVRDESANDARIEHRNEALMEAAKTEVDPQTGKLDGDAILERLVDDENEQSDLAESQDVEDGSIPETDRVIARSEFESFGQAETVIFDAVKNNTGVKRGIAGQKATQEEVRKVLKGKKAA